ncbi:MAG TPA: hypothetical protein VL989_01690 [Candidatus Sulfotelmatobacter sp.]|nr:hypothetical protein [Candidatus Sulfotelmatobacter sp.]
MDSAKQQLIDKLKSSNNVLVTVSRNPSVDQLSALLGLSLIMNKLGKHSAAVFSGQIPSTLGFLKPENTIEKTTDSLRDFIIALDKNKADKLRYKVEDNIVRIFITPYRTKIGQEDLEFSQGDFNVDIVVALGVTNQSDLDEAITAHGRILHDATVASINTSQGAGDLGAINWSVPTASSLSELVAELSDAIGGKLFDEQIATALLTGIVAETDRFSNEKTSSQTMNISGELMSAGANQQLIATQLEEAPTDGGIAGTQATETNDGTLEIEHDPNETPPPKPEEPKPAEPEAPKEEEPKEENEIKIPEDIAKSLASMDEDKPVLPPSEPARGLSKGAKLVTEPPTLGGTLTANSQPAEYDPVTDPLSVPQNEDAALLDRKNNAPPPPPPSPAPTPPQTDATLAPPPEVAQTVQPAYTPPPASWQPPSDSNGLNAGAMPQLNIDENGTLSELEEAVHSPHLNNPETGSNESAAREEVNKAIQDSPTPQITPVGPEQPASPDATNETNGQAPPPVPPPVYKPPA